MSLLWCGGSLHTHITITITYYASVKLLFDHLYDLPISTIRGNRLGHVVGLTEEALDASF